MKKSYRRIALILCILVLVSVFALQASAIMGPIPDFTDLHPANPIMNLLIVVANRIWTWLSKILVF